MGYRLRRIEFVSDGFEQILNCPGVEAVVAAEARRQAQLQEAKTGEPYEVERMAGATSRVVYVARPDGDEVTGRIPHLTHERWMREVWPRVGGPSWRPHR